MLGKNLRKILISLACFVFLMVLSGSVGAQTDGVDIPDPKLRAKLEAALDKSPGDPITAAELATLTRIVAYSRNISDLTGLEYCVNLERLYLYDNKISDIRALAGLNSLQSLYLYSNQISDISALAGLNNLQYLLLFYNQIIDISALAKLNSLQSLSINNNQISDISALAGLNNLQYLLLSNNQISDISALAELNNLQDLFLNRNQISDISALAELNNLQRLNLFYNQISDISALAGLNNLQRLYLDGNQIRDLQPLVDNPGLGAEDKVFVHNNPLSYGAINTDIPTLLDRGVGVFFDNRTPTTLMKISGDGQTGVPQSTLPDPFVVQVEDQNGAPFEGVPVTFSVTAGGGLLSNNEDVETVPTDDKGLAETTLTLGASPCTNTVEAAAADITAPVIFTVTVLNVPPTANAGGPYIGDEGSPISFDASGSSDPDGNPLQYQWDFDNDGTWDTGWSSSPYASNTWPDDWTGTAKVEVSDGELTDTATTTVTVLNVSPTANADGPYTGNEGAAIAFTGSATDPGNDTLTYEWDLDGDGVFETPGQNVQKTWPDDYSGPVTLRVTDDDDGVSTASTTVTVNTTPTTIPAVVDIDPDTLNSKSKGKWITCYIEVETFDVNLIDVSTVLFEGVVPVPAESHPTEVGDYDEDGIPDLMVKFDRSDVCQILDPGDEVEITVTGELTDGRRFIGSDTIRVIDKGG